MGIRGKDHMLARLCRKHHEAYQGKYRSWFVRNNQLEVWTAFLEDGLNLLSDFRFETMGKTQKTTDDEDVF
ncbi:MAG: hypothetical protein GY841_15745 [FCB group bacterium]|nr:hypothetical protein [FCB group bacterium]